MHKTIIATAISALFIVSTGVSATDVVVTKDNFTGDSYTVNSQDNATVIIRRDSGNAKTIVSNGTLMNFIGSDSTGETWYAPSAIRVLGYGTLNIGNDSKRSDVNISVTQTGNSAISVESDGNGKESFLNIYADSLTSRVADNMQFIQVNSASASFTANTGDINGTVNAAGKSTVNLNIGQLKLTAAKNVLYASASSVISINASTVDLYGTVEAQTNGKISFDGGTINVYRDSAFSVQNGSQLTIQAAKLVDHSAEGGDFYTSHNGGSATINVKEIELNGTLNAGLDHELTINSDIVKVARIASCGGKVSVNTEQYIGSHVLRAENAGSISIDAKTIDIQTNNQACISTWGNGSSTSSVNLKADTIYLKAEGIRNIDGKGEGKASVIEMAPANSDFVSNVTISATQDITLEGDIRTTYYSENSDGMVGTANITIGDPNSDAKVTIVGDIYNGANEANSEVGTNSSVNVNLTGAGSSITGKIEDGNMIYAEGATGGVTLNMGAQTQLNLTDASAVSNVNSSGGVISTEGHQLQVSEMTTAADTTTTITTDSIESGQINIGTNSGEIDLLVSSDGTAGLSGNVSEDIRTLTSIMNVSQTDSGYTIHGMENAVIGDTEIVVDPTGSVVSYSEQTNTVNAGLEDIAGANFLYFRSTMNDVSKRMGDLRTLPNAPGAWARYYGGKMEYGDRGMDTTYNTLQIGADQRIGNFYVGMSMSISDGDSDLTNGSVDHRNYNFGLYGGWLGESGQYVDVIVKRHRLETEGSLRNTSGIGNSFDYNNWGTSVSLEYGWRFACPNTGFWVEPQAEIMYGKVDATSFTTSQNANVSQDSIDTLVGRFGTAIGYTFAENRGSAYFKASVLHDWRGETDSTVSVVGGGSRSYHDDLGGTWGEFSLGGTYNITDKFSAYGDVMTSTGSPIHNPWEISIGLRYTF